jgi:hypothetical protein
MMKSLRVKPPIARRVDVRPCMMHESPRQDGEVSDAIGTVTVGCASWNSSRKGSVQSLPPSLEGSGSLFDAFSKAMSHQNLPDSTLAIEN